ncbi:MAG: hypothetical protein GKR90_26735 [Pseudomonadales bacterium]|nr:hypothetical protein [Pseudomonadales bacterium]
MNSVLPRGQVLQRVLSADPEQSYRLYIPLSGMDGGVLVCAHGLNDDGSKLLDQLQPFCEQAGLTLLIPHFHKRGYQQLMPVRSDRQLDLCVAEVGALLDVNVSKFSLFGYSAGAQFAHRYVMAYPHRVRRAVIAGSGWYTFPTPSERYPYGIRASRKSPIAFNPEYFLTVPILVLIGSKDTERRNLRATERVNENQGFTRLDRARRWVIAMQEAALAHSVPPMVRLHVVDGVGHKFSDFCQNGGLCQIVSQFAADEAPSIWPA